MENSHVKSIQTVLKELGVNREGLQVREVRARQKKYGPNELPEKAPVSLLIVFFRQFVNPLIIVLIVALVISMVLHEWVDAAVIGAAIGVNTLIGFIQEYKASRALSALRNLVQPKAVVRRNGEEEGIPASEVVPGDILVLSTGDRVSADVRILEQTDLQLNEAALTGESLPVHKHTNVMKQETVVADRENMAFAGTHIVAGRGLGVVVATGVETELGKIAKLVEETVEKPTPLQTELQQLARWISGLVVALVLMLFVIGITAGREVFEMFELAVAIAVAAVPEGLAIGVTIILAIGMQRILRQKALVRRLVAAETLGSVSVICTDKTGTITEGRMRVSEVTHDEDLVLKLAMLCNDASVKEGTDLKKAVVHGSPTETALMEAGLRKEISYRSLTRNHKRYAEVPFTSKAKFMMTLNAWEDVRAILVKGAPEKLISASSHVFENGKTHVLDKETTKALQAQASEMAERGLRVLAVAYRPVKKDTSVLSDEDLHDLVFAGFIGLQDPLRDGVFAQIEAAKRAGIRTVVITGDHPKTALAIAKEAGVAKTSRDVVDGARLDKWDDNRLSQEAASITVYARVEPRHKIRIVDALQARHEVVSMVGDGVNDAPAIKAADMGIAVGSGTEVAKQASDMVLLDNNISTITHAIEQGRVIFDNIRKTTVYLLADSFTSLILITGALLFKLPLPLLPVQILWVNLVADSLPNVGLTFEPGEKDVMKLPPRPRKEPVVESRNDYVDFYHRHHYRHRAVHSLLVVSATNRRRGACTNDYVCGCRNRLLALHLCH